MIAAVLVAALPTPSLAQRVDAAVEVKEGALASYAADFEVGIFGGITASLQEEKWYVAGSCSNEPTVTIAMKTGLGATLADYKVGIVSLPISADRIICITNVEALSDELKKELGLLRNAH